MVFRGSLSNLFVTRLDEQFFASESDAFLGDIIAHSRAEGIAMLVVTCHFLLTTCYIPLLHWAKTPDVRRTVARLSLWLKTKKSYQCAQLQESTCAENFCFDRNHRHQKTDKKSMHVRL